MAFSHGGRSLTPHCGRVGGSVGRALPDDLVHDIVAVPSGVLGGTCDPRALLSAPPQKHSIKITNQKDRLEMVMRGGGGGGGAHREDGLDALKVSAEPNLKRVLGVERIAHEQPANHANRDSSGWLGTSLSFAPPPDRGRYCQSEVPYPHPAGVIPAAIRPWIRVPRSRRPRKRSPHFGARWSLWKPGTYGRCRAASHPSMRMRACDCARRVLIHRTALSVGEPQRLDLNFRNNLPTSFPRPAHR